MNKSSRSSAAEAYHWVSIVTTVTLEMVLPAYGGSLLDKRWSTGSALVTTGACLGMLVAITHLLQLTKKPPSGNKKSS
ncbi:MAG: hypothetical protein P8M30_03825 [Planctomycetaceae bacterium]|jgi:hypothetical protein|nr:hypothetical protein [Planctomycetaceae bacterium]MDG2388432.1 hypothetical protein [Planctomycetaceae bacterium]